LPSAALGKAGFAECPIKSTRQSHRHSAKARIPVVHIAAVSIYHISTLYFNKKLYWLDICKCGVNNQDFSDGRHMGT
jgi:hypothetical protein